MKTPDSQHKPNRAPGRSNPLAEESEHLEGRSGEGADSVLPHLHEQEERRKPLNDR